MSINFLSFAQYPNQKGNRDFQKDEHREKAEGMA